MSFKQDLPRLFRYILEAIEMIEQFTSGMGFAEFRTNPMVVAAVERKIQVISEAAIRLAQEAERRKDAAPINYGVTSGGSVINFAMRTSGSTLTPFGALLPTICRL